MGKGREEGVPWLHDPRFWRRYRQIGTTAKASISSPISTVALLPSFGAGGGRAFPLAPLFLERFAALAFPACC